ncbi:hypothetical protein MLD63_11595 [Paracoccus sp. TK19116]|uniref:Uncharacterized protein n=1 Tax=Paracoccus albicereus TaxID=2922394 RepID=A0ABT1MS91_9RHOB|nr:hypothetical protein [Paracoccus albicereus]MCQ0971066.1 hypothetical protein [Paracoccus albicereus]
MTLTDFLDCLAVAGQAGPAHTSTLGWATVGAYATCAALAVIVLRLRGRSAGRTFWRLVVVVSAALAVNEAIGAQWVVAALGECIARRDGWYGGRGGVQGALVAMIVVVAALLFTILIVAARRHLRGNWAAALGMLLLVDLAGLRMVSLHGLDRVLERPVAMISLAAMLEILGVGLIAVNALRHLTRPPSRRKRRRSHRPSVQGERRTRSPAGHRAA